MPRAAVALLLSALSPAKVDAASKGQVIVLASHHLANNNRDLINLPIEDITTPVRQNEIAHMVDGIARW